MSILLESLKQSKTPDEGDVPSVADSHFDDEMLSDEWLLKKIRFWRLVAIALLIFVVTSSTFYIYYVLSTKDKIDQLQSEMELISRPELETKKTSTVGEKKEEATQISTQASSEKEQQITASNAKQKYKPTKQKIIREKKVSSSSPVQESISSKSLVPSSKPIEFESLSEQERSEIPDLEINSYAVSSNANKSFVVLNGSFYGQGEIIAPHLVLVSIDKEGIVIKYKNKLIRKKYSID